MGLYPDAVLRTRVQWSITVLNFMYEALAGIIHLVLLLQEEVYQLNFVRIGLKGRFAPVLKTKCLRKVDSGPKL